MTLEGLIKLVFEELDTGLSDYIRFEYNENLSDKFMGYL
jgi:hypothetical protein